MPELAAVAEQSEAQFAELVDALAADPDRYEMLANLLREDHPLYRQRSAAAIVRMRGWVLLALARTGVSDRDLPFVLEEFDAGTDAYLVATAARALRAYAHPKAGFASFLMRALTNIRDEPLSFENYGEYATSSTGTSAVRELLTALAWLGPHARTILPDLASMRTQPGRFSKKLLAELDGTVAVIRGTSSEYEDEMDACCTLTDGLGQRQWVLHERGDTKTVESIGFEDQDGAPVRFREFFHGNPSIVVFFYTRCDNPWKCSLTVTKLARVQQLLRERGLADKVQTVAITYDPAFDLPKRLRAYGQDRGVRFDVHHRMLRSTEGFATLRNHFNLGVNFIESLVNRHRIELYVLDTEGRVAARFERVRWDESQVVDRASEVLREDAAPLAASPSVKASAQAAATIFGTLASIAWVFVPKCPICWAAYLSAFGVAGLRQLPHPSEIGPALAAIMLINIVSVWFRARAIRRMSGFYFVCAGAMLIILAKTVVGWENIAVSGAALTIAGSLWSAANQQKVQLYLQRIWRNPWSPRGKGRR